MRVHSVLLTAPRRGRSLIRLKLGQFCFNVWTRVVLKSQLTLMIDTAMNRSGMRNCARSHQQQRERVFHHAFKLPNARIDIRAPAFLRRNLFSCAPLAVCLIFAGCSDQSTQYAGIWKNRCDDYWGVQIKPADDGLYSVTFCGLSGCLEPGDWLLNTAIVDDPVYKVISPTQIRITRGTHPPLTYIRCSQNPDWATFSMDVR